MILPENQKGVFVTGTGTEVGKTLVSIGLCLKFKTGYWKPVQTGEPGDEEYVRSFLPPEKICPGAVRLKSPLSPNQAARKEGRPVSLSQIRWPERKDFLIVEGIGGVLVPLNDSETLLDLIRCLKLPVIVVASSGLGTLNHSLLTLRVLKQNQIPVLGLVLSGPSHPDNKRDLEVLGRVPVLLELPLLASVTKENLLKAFDSFKTDHLY